MMRFPKNRQELVARLRAAFKSTRRFVTRNRTVVVATTCALTLGIVVSAWALSGGNDDSGNGRRATMTKRAPSARAKVGRTTRVASSDPLAAGRRLFDAKKYDQAIDAFQPLVRENVEARFWLGKAHLAVGHGFRGCRQLDKYLDKAPKGRYARAAKAGRKDC